MNSKRPLSFWLKRVRISIERRGFCGTARRALLHGRLYFTPSGWRERRFDSHFGVHTSGHIGQYELGITVPNVVYSGEYRPTPVWEFVRIVEDLHINHSQWVFIDFGAGKGRAVLLACQFPFKRVIGVELAAELASIAQSNITRYRNSAQQCRDVMIACEDAAQYALPGDKAVIYLNNPFRGPVMECVVENIGLSLQAHPREIYVVYWNPFCADVLDAAPFLVKVRKGTQYCVYRSRAADECIA